MIRYLIIFLLATGIAQTNAADSVRVDLKKSWLMLDSGKLIPFSGGGHVAYIRLQELTPGLVIIQGSKNFDIFLNNQLVAGETRVYSKVVESTPGTLAIYCRGGLDQVSTTFVTTMTENVWLSKPAFNSNALIILAFLLTTLLIVLIRFNPAAAFEYFNVVKLFSLRGSEDSALTMRITSANNVFYYLFCSALAALNLFIFSVGNEIFSLSFFAIILGVLKLMGLVFGLLVMKIVLIGLMSSLFRLTDFGPTQFHNYVRLLLISFLGCSVVLVFLVMFEANWVKSMLPMSYCIVGLSIIFVLVTFLKLIARGGFTVFHLFSYLCVSEIIPLIILLNVYFS